MSTLSVVQLEARRARGRKYAAKKRAARTPEEKERIRFYMVEWRRRNPEKTLGYGQRRWQDLKAEMISALGGECACCAISDPIFLTLDHVNGDGEAHRRSLGGPNASYAVHEDARREGWPKEKYRVLCWNCNMATRYGRTCPHQQL